MGTGCPMDCQIHPRILLGEALPNTCISEQQTQGVRRARLPHGRTQSRPTKCQRRQPEMWTNNTSRRQPSRILSTRLKYKLVRYEHGPKLRHSFSTKNFLHIYQSDTTTLRGVLGGKFTSPKETSKDNAFLSYHDTTSKVLLTLERMHLGFGQHI